METKTKKNNQKPNSSRSETSNILDQANEIYYYELYYYKFTARAVPRKPEKKPNHPQKPKNPNTLNSH